METNKLTFSPADTNEPFIFASYAHEDSDAVSDIEKLHDLGFRIWYDEKIEDAEQWQIDITAAIEHCKLFLIFVTMKSVNSKWVRREINTADEDNKKIMPVFFEEGRIKTNNLVINDFCNIQGIERFRFVKDNNLEGYYAELTTALPKETRKCDEERDCEILGMCSIPGIKNIVNHIEINPEHDRQILVQKLIEEVRNTGRAVYSIETVFQLTSDKTNAVENLGKAYLINPSRTKPSNLLSHPLNIGTAYMAPLRLITGLITRLDENWPPLVASYRTLVRCKERNLLDDFHYFIEFCWLAWGPSVLTTSLLKDNSMQFMVVQAAFGDEANSLPLIMKKEKWHEIVSEFQKQHNRQIVKEKFEYRSERGWPVQLENVLIVKPQKDPFFKGLSNHELFSNIFTKKEEEDIDQVALYLPSGNEGCNTGTATLCIDKQETFYSTAYVWLMIEEDRDSSGKLTPGRVIPFFEHANLATSKGLDFLQHCLARKAIYHVLDCERDPDYSEKGYYRFSTALFPEQMVEILGEEIDRLRQEDKKTLQKRFRIPKNPDDWRSESDVIKFADAVGAAIMKGCKALNKDSGSVRSK